MGVRRIISLKERLLEDMKVAMKNKEKERLSVIRMVRASIKNVEIDKRKDLEELEVVEVVAKEVKQRRDSYDEYKKLGQDKMAAKLKDEIAILSDYLPEQLDHDEIEELVEDVINEVGASTSADLGKVMGAIMPRVKGRADGKVINSIVREKLS